MELNKFSKIIILMNPENRCILFKNTTLVIIFYFKRSKRKISLLYICQPNCIWVLQCDIRSSSLSKDMLHALHINFRIFIWELTQTRSCLARWYLLLNFLPQILHSYLSAVLSACCSIQCRLQCSFRLNSLLQIIQVLSSICCTATDKKLHKNTKEK